MAAGALRETRRQCFFPGDVVAFAPLPSAGSKARFFDASAAPKSPPAVFTGGGGGGRGFPGGPGGGGGRLPGGGGGRGFPAGGPLGGGGLVLGALGLGGGGGRTIVVVDAMDVFMYDICCVAILILASLLDSSIVHQGRSIKRQEPTFAAE